MTDCKKFDDFDKGILSERQSARYSRNEHLIGDIILHLDGSKTRITHVWNDTVQNTTGKDENAINHGGFYLGCSGAMSYSGSLNEGLPKTHLKNTNSFEKVKAWFFHHGRSEAHNGVHFECRVRVWQELSDSEAINPAIPQRYIVDEKSQYNAGIQTYTYTTFDGVERVGYSGNKTLTEYLALKGHENYIVLSEKERTERTKKFLHDQCTKPKECSEEHYYEMLEVLPPCRWNGSLFHVSERLTHNLVNWYFKKDKKYYGFVSYDNLTNDQLNEIIANT